jgi:hypothetical protein
MALRFVSAFLSGFQPSLHYGHLLLESSHGIVWLDVAEVLNIISSVRLMRCDERALSFSILSPLSTLSAAFGATGAGCGSREVLVAGCLPPFVGPG